MGISAFIVFFAYAGILFVSQMVMVRKRRVPIVRAPEAPIKTMMNVMSLPFLFTANVYAIRQHTHVVLVILACLFAAIGLVISLRAQKELGRFWVGGVGIHKQHKLITTGLYSHVRHPLYSGIAFSSLGIAVCSLNPWFIGAVICFVTGFAARSVKEDMMLYKRFPKQYPTYAATTGALIPKIRRSTS